MKLLTGHQPKGTQWNKTTPHSPPQFHQKTRLPRRPPYATINTFGLQVVLAGDANFDGLVTGGDFTIWADRFGQSGVGYSGGDFNSDRVVSGADFTIWADHFGQVAPPAAAVPEPSAWFLALLALAALPFQGAHRR